MAENSFTVGQVGDDGRWRIKVPSGANLSNHEFLERGDAEACAALIWEELRGAERAVIASGDDDAIKALVIGGVIGMYARRFPFYLADRSGPCLEYGPDGLVSRITFGGPAGVVPSSPALASEART